MTNAQKRNERFAKLVEATKVTPFGKRLLELGAFADGAGCALKFDAEGFELWSNKSPSATMVFKC